MTVTPPPGSEKEVGVPTPENVTVSRRVAMALATARSAARKIRLRATRSNGRLVAVGAMRPAAPPAVSWVDGGTTQPPPPTVGVGLEGVALVLPGGTESQ
jgi:hypothetical protein